MTIQLDSTITCPRWCAGKHDDLNDPTLRVHVRDVACGDHRRCPVTTARASQLGRAVVAAIEADMTAAGLPVGVLARRAGIPRARLVRRLAGAGLYASELQALALVLGRRPSEWMVTAEQAVEQSHR